MFDKKIALKQFRSVINDIDNLKTRDAFSSEHTKWLALTTDLLEKIFGTGSRYFLTFKNYSWQKVGQFIIGGISDRMGSMNPQAAINREHHKAYLEQLESAEGLLEAAYIAIENTADLDSLHKSKNKFDASNLTIRIVNLAEKSLR
ncbi:MAG: hypothetical protein ACYCXK_11835, partial [Candidatus Humimicrobiaceae bacterium]